MRARLFCLAVALPFVSFGAPLAWDGLHSLGEPAGWARIVMGGVVLVAAALVVLAGPRAVRSRAGTSRYAPAGSGSPAGSYDAGGASGFDGGGGGASG